MTAAASDVSSATSAVEALTATTNSAETTPTIASALASFKFGPEEAAKPTMDGDAALIKPLKDAAEAVESVPMDLESSLNQSALKMLQMDYHSNFDSVEDLEDGEVRDKAKLPPPSSTSTPIDLAKSPENKKHQAHGLARKKLELSPPSSPNKVCLNLDMIQDGLAASDKEAACPKFATEPRPIFLKNPDPELVHKPAPELVYGPVPALVLKSVPALAPALEPDLEHEAQAASIREAAGTETKAKFATEPRPRRSCTINSYIADNYVLDTKTVS